MLVFLRLVALQDSGLAVQESRSRAAEEFGLTVEQVMAIENEGLARDWPPLDPRT